MNKTASSSGTTNSDLEAMMAELGLKEDELQDVVVDEAELMAEANRWMAIARVHTDKTYSQYWFYKNMRVAWDLAQEVKIRPLEDNLYSMQFSCLGDWERVMEEGPWNFKGKSVVLAPYDGFTKPSLIELNKIDIWIQIHDLPDGFFSKVKALSATVGEFIFAEPKSHDFEGNFVRVRVRIDVTKPLKNVVSLVVRKKDSLERVIFRVKYERLPDWCEVCGHLGHLFKECGDGVHPPQAMVFKELRASWFRRPGSGPGERAGTRGGRGRGRNGRGGGRSTAQSNPFSNKDSEDLEHTEDDVTMVEAENRKRGAAGSEVPKPSHTNHTIASAAKTQLMLPPLVVPPSPTSKQEPKRSKASPSTNEVDPAKNATPNKNSDARLVGLPVGSRLAQ
ncbi:hypothetical protein ACQJBY_055305 [Aegilops geniculata]